MKTENFRFGSRVRIAGTTPRRHICDTREAAPSFRARLAQTGSAHHRPRSQDNGPCSRSSRVQEATGPLADCRSCVDLRRLGAAQRMRAVGGALHPGTLDPAVHYARVLASRQMGLVVDSARKDVGASICGTHVQPVLQRGSGLFRDLKLNRTAGLVLDDRGWRRRGSERGSCSRPGRVLEKPAARTTEGPAMGKRLEPGADCPSPAGGLPGRRDHAHQP